MAKEKLSGSELAKAKEEVIKKLAEARGVDVSTIKSDKMVGNNGRPLDSKVTFTGKVDLISRNINGNVVHYYAAETITNDWISLQSLMGVSSLQNYKLSGTFQHKNTEETKEVTAYVSEKFAQKPSDYKCWEPPTRDFYECVAQLQATEKLKDVTLYFRGIAVRDYTAKKNVTTTTESWEKGDPRTMTAQIWTIN